MHHSDALLAFYDFPAEHWKHLRTTNPIESSFATVRLVPGAAAIGRGADDHQQALRGLLEPGLHMDAVDPEVNVAVGREITLAPNRPMKMFR